MNTLTKINNTLDRLNWELNGYIAHKNRPMIRAIKKQIAHLEAMKA